jgi:hypothetical protein
MSGAAALWAAVAAVGIYHGLNPAMGWPLAVARGLERKRSADVFASWLPLGVGHLLAMALVLVPFALLTWMLDWSREIRIGAGVLVLLFGMSQLVLPHRHRWQARIRPTQLALWSFLMASAHGAALMLLPMLMGLCEPSSSAGGRAMGELMRSGAGTALMVALVHTVAMIGAGLGLAWVVYRYLGLRALRTAWIDLDKVWALGLMTAGAAALATA